MSIKRGHQRGHRGSPWRALGILAAMPALHVLAPAGAGPIVSLDQGQPVEVGSTAPTDITGEGARLEGLAAAYLDWIARVAGSSGDQVERLSVALDDLVEEAVVEARRMAEARDPDWVESAWEALLTSSEWTSAWEGGLNVEQQTALNADRASREARLEAASGEVLLRALTVELRLREAQADALREPVMAWLEDPRWRRDRATSTDLTAAVVTFKPVRTLLAREQVNRLVRMRAVSAAGRSSGRGGARALGGGRFPEDDFVLEALALAAYHGWSEEQATLLTRGATAMGREFRRDRWKPRRTGERNLLRAVVDLDQQLLWKALVRREEARHAVDGAAPGPWRDGDRGVLVGARGRLMLEHLDQLLLLDDGRREALGAALQREVGREVDRGALGLGAIGARPLLRALGLPQVVSANGVGAGVQTRAKVQPRAAFMTDLRQVLSADQLKALGVEESGR